MKSGKATVGMHVLLGPDKARGNYYVLVKYKSSKL
jgi:hypothetical protein